MVKLIVPTVARAFVKDVFNYKTLKVTGTKESKFHLLNVNTDDPSPGTVCHFIWPNIEGRFVEKPIDQLEPDQLCRKCLGAMRMEGATGPVVPDKSPFPGFGDLLLSWEFEKMCKDGLLIDYDGTGYYANEDASYYHDKPAIPSAVLRDGIDHTYTHVLWFNR